MAADEAPRGAGAPDGDAKTKVRRLLRLPPYLTLYRTLPYLAPWDWEAEREGVTTNASCNWVCSQCSSQHTQVRASLTLLVRSPEPNTNKSDLTTHFSQITPPAASSQLERLPCCRPVLLDLHTSQGHHPCSMPCSMRATDSSFAAPRCVEVWC